jgi:hypothetical protein
MRKEEAMNFKTLALAAATVSMLSGAAIAQTNTVDDTNTASTNSPKANSLLENKEMMGSFYTDDSMTTMRTGDEFKSAFNAMSSEDRDRLRTECENSTSQKDEFCNAIKDIQ